MSQTTSEVPGLTSTESGAMDTRFPGFSDKGKTQKGTHAAPDDSFVRHDAYFFKDGNVTFLVSCLLCFAHPTY